MIQTGKLTMGHARALSKIENKEEIVKMATDITEKGLTVRDVEQQSENIPKKTSNS